MSANNPLPSEALAQLFTEARTHNGWRDREVPDALLREAVDISKWGPTSANCSPLRIVFVRSPEAKARLAPALAPGNLEKTMAAPATAILAYDLAFHEHLPRLFPAADARSWFVGNPPLIEETAFRNATLQAAYLILALAGAWARHGADERVRQSRRGRRVLSRRRREVEFSAQHRLWRTRQALPARSTTRLRGNGANFVIGAEARGR